MKEQKKKKELTWRNYIAMVFFAAIGAACGILMARFMGNRLDETITFGQKMIRVAFLLIGMYLAILLQIIFHEAGHLVFGLISGYQFSSFRIMSFMWVKESGKLRFRRLSIAGMGGQCLMSPPEPIDGTMPVFLYNLGGVFMNFIVSAIAFGLYLVIDDVPILAVFLMMLALIGVAIALINGIPMRMGSVDNDDYNAFSLRSNKEAQRAFWVQMKVNEQIANGVRIKDMPDKWFEVPSDEAMKNSMVAALGVFACSRLVDAHHFEEADKLMMHLLEIDSGIVGLHRNLMICDRIYIELITEKRKDLLDGLYTKEQEKFMKSMKNFPSIIRTEYAYALLGTQDIEKAGKFKALFEKCAKTYPYPNEVQSERELMEIAEGKG
ncbi:MAG: M50 family metallopeptidase [Muribaculaceae bacterium]|nr:M50 family metallopeptidase [Muribaculaceae bacterium]